MSAGVVLYTSGKAKRLKTLPQLIDGETKNGLRRGLNRLRTALFQEFKETPIARAYLRKGAFARSSVKASIKTVIARERVKKDGESYSVGIRIKGFAAKVARGERTEAHDIGLDGKLLVNAGSGFGGGGVFAAMGKVRHPGARLQRDEFQQRSLSKTQGEFRKEVALGLSRVAQRVDRG